MQPSVDAEVRALSQTRAQRRLSSRCRGRPGREKAECAWAELEKVSAETLVWNNAAVAGDEENDHMTGKTALIVGVGHPEGVGCAVARRFAREGFQITAFGRNAAKLDEARRNLRELSPTCEVVVGDVTDEAVVSKLVADCDRPDAPLEVAVFNAGGNWPSGYLDMDAAFLEGMWRVNALAGFLFSKAAIARMLPRKRGTMIFTGATASLRGRTGFGGFASAKAALRALAQSCAREFGPQGIHVAHVVIDGAVDGDRINTLIPNLKSARGEDGLLSPDAIAENYWSLHCQQRSAWTHELDVRPWSETW
jgi:NAD(P)-dependent dehydrogenase (short-subunit alcohol dehydrogenase family)